MPASICPDRSISRIDAMFDRLRAADRRAFATYAVASDPSFEESLAELHGFVAAGIDLIELGYPFSDPILDGATIQKANRRGMEAGGNLARTLDLVAAFRETDSATPIVLMGYANPLAVMGYEAFAARAAASGVDGIIVADMPLREAGALLAALAMHGMVMIPLFAMTLEEKDVAPRPGVGGFLYCIPVVGPTGGPSATIETIGTAVACCRRSTTLPVMVGFGIKTPEAAAAVATIADGVIVASALIDLVDAEAGPAGVQRLSRYSRHIGAFRQAIDLVPAN
jgi:tryptophan synthase alpha chain